MAHRMRKSVMQVIWVTFLQDQTVRTLFVSSSIHCLCFSKTDDASMFVTCFRCCWNLNQRQTGKRTFSFPFSVWHFPIYLDFSLISQIPLSGQYSILGRAVVVHADPDDLGKGRNFFMALNMQWFERHFGWGSAIVLRFVLFSIDDVKTIMISLPLLTCRRTQA